MKFLITLAWKNLSRYRKRTIITAAALAFGLGLYIFMDSMLMGAEVESERNLIWFETSSARIMHQDYWAEKDSLPLKYALDNTGELLARLDKEGIAATTRTVFFGEIIMLKDPYPEDGAMFTKIFAIDPATDEDVFEFKKTIEAGRYLEPGEEGVMLGSWLAEDIGAEIGFPLTIVTRGRDGYKQTIDVEVVGIINCPNPYVNRASMFITLDTADYYLSMEGGVTEIDLKYKDYNEAEKVSIELEKKLGKDLNGWAILPWQILAKDYVMFSEMKKGGSSIFLLLVFVIAAVGVSNTMLMAVFERERELGMMRAMGMKDSQVKTAFFIEAAGIGIIGSICGIILGIILDFWLVNYGIDFSFMIRDMDIGYRISGIFYGAWNFTTMIQALIIGVFMTVGVAYFPIRRGLKLEITEALRDK
ncbi:hypothetical protein ES705_25099 [subsurface metagenome]